MTLRSSCVCVAFALDNLAIFLDLSGHPEKAEPLYRESLAMLRRIYGEEHVEVAQTMGNLAEFLLDTKGPDQGGSAADIEEMESLFRGALTINRRFRPRHPFVGDNLSSLAALESQRGDHRQAESLSREALRIYRGKLSESHSKTVSERVQLGEILLAQGRPREAEPLVLAPPDDHEFAGRRRVDRWCVVAPHRVRVDLEGRSE